MKDHPTWTVPFSRIALAAARRKTTKMIKMVATAVGTMLAETTDVTAVQDNNNYYTLQYIHYFVIHTSITRNRNRKPHNKS